VVCQAVLLGSYAAAENFKFVIGVSNALRRGLDVWLVSICRLSQHSSRPRAAR
jgi:hypothetical protein